MLAPPVPLPEPVRRAINREPTDDVEWENYEPTMDMMPLPGGCLFTLRPRPRNW